MTARVMPATVAPRRSAAWWRRRNAVLAIVHAIEDQYVAELGQPIEATLTAAELEDVAETEAAC